MRSLPLISGLLVLFLSLSTLAQTAGDSVADFGFDYFSRVAKTENTVVSPLSIHACFAMLTLGTSGETETETLKVLGLKEGFEESYHHLLLGLRFAEELKPGRKAEDELPGQVSLASRIWPSQKLNLKSAFKKDCQETFGAAPESLNFGNSKEARKRINEWVSKLTQELIPELLPPGALDSSTELVLTNALYFKGTWQSGFDPLLTRPGTFHAPAGEVEVPMMHGQQDALFFESKDLTAVSMPYKSGPFAMLFVGPKVELADCKAKLNRKLLSDVEMNAMSHRGKVRVTLPKFTISQESEPLPVLKSMGMVKLLGDRPDFSRLAENPDGLAVDKCFHQAVVEVDESGTKAAAATAVVTVRSPMPTIVLDRPFFFVLYHRSTLAPLFIGQVVDPTK